MNCEKDWDPSGPKIRTHLVRRMSEGREAYERRETFKSNWNAPAARPVTGCPSVRNVWKEGGSVVTWARRRGVRRTAWQRLTGCPLYRGSINSPLRYSQENTQYVTLAATPVKTVALQLLGLRYSRARVVASTE